MNSIVACLGFIISFTMLFTSASAIADKSARDFTGRYKCTLGAHDESHAWQIKTDTLVVKHGQGLLKLTIGNTTASAEYGMSGEGPLISAQLKDRKSGFRSTTDLEVTESEFNVGLYDDNSANGGATAQLDCEKIESTN